MFALVLIAGSFLFLSHKGDSTDNNHLLLKPITNVLKELNNAINNLTRFLEPMKGEPPAIAFMADSMHESIRDLSKNQVLVFENAITNVGNAYNSSSGTFRAPFGGIYFFTASLIVHPPNRLVIGISKNGKNVAYLYFEALNESSGNRPQGGLPMTKGAESITVHLNIGDIVNVRIVKWHGDDAFMGNGPNSRFSGFLVLTKRKQKIAI